jgi:hypothetical protein
MTSGSASTTIRSLYPFALAEGEGVGTAYEYVAKRTFLRPLADQLARPGRAGGAPARLLVAGLPEKYGCSLDFAIFADSLGADLLVVDDRDAALARAEKVVSSLKGSGRLAGLQVRYEKVSSLRGLADSLRVETRDAVLSCEVLQRVPAGERGSFVDGLRSLAPRGALFVPNSENGSHLAISGLAGLTRAELTTLFPGADCEYVDMPPFPPGITRSADQRARASTGMLEAVAMLGLDTYCRAEPLVPSMVKKHVAHIVCARWGV